MDSLFGTEKNVKQMQERKLSGKSAMEPTSSAPNGEEFADPSGIDVAALRKRLVKKNDPKLTLRVLVLGEEGTGKSGIVMAHLAKNKKRSMIIDLDGGMIKNLVHYPGAEEYIHVENPLVLEQDLEGKTKINYVKTFETIKEIIRFVEEEKENYDAIVIDGISTLYEFASKQVKIDKHIQPDGEVNFKFWQIRNDYFSGVIETSRAIDGLDCIFVGHDDMQLVPGKDRVVTKGGAVIMLDKTSKSIQKLHRMVDQKVWVEKKKAKSGKVTYVARYEKARPFLELEEEEYLFATKDKGEISWTGEVVLGQLTRKKEVKE